MHMKGHLTKIQNQLCKALSILDWSWRGRKTLAVCDWDCRFDVELALQSRSSLEFSQNKS